MGRMGVNVSALNPHNIAIGYIFDYVYNNYMPMSGHNTGTPSAASTWH